MQNSPHTFDIQIDNIKSDSWYEILTQFRDANIYQTWAYDAVRYGDNSLSHLVLKNSERVIAAVQVRIMKIPLVKAGIAYVRWGPLWKRFDSDTDVECLRQVITAMRREYVEKRGLLLHIIPNELESSDCQARSVIESCGLKWIGKDYRTLYIDLKESFEMLRGSMSQSWRKQLRKAENGKIELIEGEELELFGVVNSLFKETVLRKSFLPGIDIQALLAIQDTLPKNLKMHIMVCRLEDKPIAGLIASSLGEMGIELVAATGDFGRELGGSHLLRWKMLEYLKKSGCHFYNLNGIDPENNPGVYKFKLGFCGKSDQDVMFIGSFEAGETLLNTTFRKYGKELINIRKKIISYYARKFI